MKKGRAGTMTHDYKRHGTTTLFAALNVLDGTVVARNMQRHRHQEFIRFLNAVEVAVPTDRSVHAILDNYAAHKHPKSLPSGLTRGSAPGSTATRAGPSISCRPPPPGSMPSRAYSPNSPGEGSNAASSTPSSTSRPPSTASCASTTPEPKPFTWTTDPDAIIAAVRRGHQTLDSNHSHVRHYRMQAREFVACAQALARALPGRAGGAVVETTADLL
ncbi:hypothetical protein ABIE65_005180 [Constrictibacter sp. MBR-5]|jgi:hypothetical protein